jgi:hypothetical protein
MRGSFNDIVYAAKHNKLKSAIYFIILGFMLTAMCSSSDSEYHKNGISFIIPSGWRISGDFQSPDNGYVFCERKGMFPQGLMTIFWKNDSLNTYTELVKYVNQIKKDMQIQNPMFDSIRECTFGNYKALGWHYKMGVPGANSVGYLKCFYSNHRTFRIQFLEPSEYEKENESAETKLTGSFRCPEH